MNLDHIRRTEPLTNGWVRVWASDPIEGRKNLGYIRANANGTWDATPATGAEWGAISGVLTDREAIFYLMGIRYMRCAPEWMRNGMVPLLGTE